MSQNKIEKWDEINGRSHEEKLEAFLETANDSYAILQLRQDYLQPPQPLRP